MRTADPHRFLATLGMTAQREALRVGLIRLLPRAGVLFCTDLFPVRQYIWSMYKIALAVACLALAGCAASISPLLPAGHMNVSGIIAPCTPDGRNAQACGNALFNTSVISQIHKGQTQSEVRGIMRHDAERREVEGLTESWGYLTSYKDEMITWITFTDRKVSSLSHEVVGGH